MIASDLFRKKKCFLKDDHLIIDGKKFLINSLKEIPVYKIRRSSLLISIGLAFGFFPTLYILYPDIKDSIFNNPDRFDQIWSIAMFSFVLVVMAFLWWFLIKSILDTANYRSWWIVNGKGLYTEKDDNPD